jgi:lysophospholipase L1-like esterase
LSTGHHDCAFALTRDDVVVVIGDSITAQGRDMMPAAFGPGYVAQMTDLVRARHPDRVPRVRNHGLPGHGIAHLAERWDADVISAHPTWVVSLCGINDLHALRHGVPGACDAAAFEQRYTELLARTSAQGARTVVMDPFLIGGAGDAGYDAGMSALLPAFVDACARVAASTGSLHVRLHDRFAEVTRHRPAAELCPEPVHPNAAGHMVIALALLDAWGW